MNRHWVFLGALVVLGLAIAAYLLPVQDYLKLTAAWMEARPELAWIVYIFVIIAAVLLLFPSWIPLVLAGYLFGMSKGVAIGAVAYPLGAALCFVLGRTAGRRWVEKRVRKMPRFAAIDHALHHGGFKIVFLTRLAMVFPDNILNYAFGLTALRLRGYVAATTLGSFPWVIVNVYLGTTATDLAALGDGSALANPGWPVLAGQLLLVVIVVTLIARTAARALRRNVEASEEEP